MEKAIIGKKVGMTQIFDDAGKVIPVTVIAAGPWLQRRTAGLRRRARAQAHPP